MAEISAFSRAAVYLAPGQPMRIERFFLPNPRAGEAIARIRCATICGSDLHTYYGRRKSPAPSVLGHEMVGEIAAVGSDGVRDYWGRPLSVGDRVTWSMVWSCGKCFYCKRGLRPKCERLMKFGHEPATPGDELTGGFAEHCVLREGTAIFRVPDGLPDIVASPANCATATVAAVFRNAGRIEGQSVAVIGAGMLGLTACAMASCTGARYVMAVEPDAARRELAARFGATDTADGKAAPEELRSRVCEATGGPGADVVMEFSGVPEAVEAGAQLLGSGGRYVMAGSTFPARPIQLSAEQLVRQMIRITGVYNYDPEDLGQGIDFLAKNLACFPFETLVGRVFGLDEVNEAMAFAESARPPRIAIRP